MTDLQVRTEINIAAPRAAVWRVLMDFDSYGEWNEVLPRIAGTAASGQTLTATIVLPGQPPSEFQPEVLQVIEAEELRWISRSEDGTSYTAEHVFMLRDSPAGSLFTNIELFAGPESEEFWPMMNTLGRAAYEEMNLALKLRVESNLADGH